MLPLAPSKMTSQFKSFFPGDIVAFQSDREVDFTLDKDDPRLSSKQHAYLENRTGSPISNIIFLQQVHGDRVIKIGPRPQINVPPGGLEQADGLITDQRGVALCVRTADCLPVFMFAPDRKVIAVIHSGWKGTHCKILSKAVAVLVNDYTCRPDRLRVALGAAIRPCCYEVGQEFREYFSGEVVTRKMKLYFDLPAANVNQLVEVGVQPANILDTKECTSCHEKYFSYRREKNGAGRMISLMMLT